MNILTLSDLHFGKKKWEDFGTYKVGRALEWAKEDLPDVLLFGGDLAEGGPENLVEGLAALGTIPAKHKIFVCGNNDLECLTGKVSQYVEELAPIVEAAGFSLLDKGPVLVDGVAFVGGLGWYDGSLWRNSGGGDFTTESDVREKANIYWYEEMYGNRVDCSPNEFFLKVQAKMREDVNSLGGSTKFVLCSHFAPSPEFVLYGDNPKYDYLNWFMGSDQTKKGSLYYDPRVVRGFCGHTHRSDNHKVGNVDVYNISGQAQPRCFSV